VIDISAYLSLPSVQSYLDSLICVPYSDAK
jgi:hypothetical protein